MNNLGKRIVLAVMVFLVVIGLVWFVRMLVKKVDQQELTRQESKEGLHFWYANDQITPYLKTAAKEFYKETGVEVHLSLVSSDDYVESIYKESIAKDAALPDLYLLRNDKLESAWMAGITSMSKQGEAICNTDNFAKAALDAVTYKEKYIAYPLYYNTVSMVYNKDVFQNAPSDMNELMSFAENGQVPQGTERILNWDNSSYFCNYVFLADSLTLAGVCGDDPSGYLVASDRAIRGLTAYHDIGQYFAVASDSSSDAVTQGFIEGRTLCILADCNMIRKIEQAKSNNSMSINYAIAELADISGEAMTAHASYTQAVVVNGLSTKQSLASEFAEYLAVDQAGKLYETAGFFAAKKGIKYKQTELNGLYKIYEQSKQFPKLFATEDLWMKIEILFSNVAGGKDITSEFQNFSQQVSDRLN